ncbi:MAG: C25 family cysteine peptidase [Bacteroidota bacterium]
MRLLSVISIVTFLSLCELADAAVLTKVQSNHSTPVKTFSVQESSADALIIDVTPGAIIEHFIDVDGKQMKQYTGAASGWTSETGKPSLPIEGFLAALPPGRISVVDVIESKFDIIEKEDIAPAPSYTFNENGEADPQYHIDRSFYATFNQFYPSTLCEIGENARIRDLAVTKILVYPLQYNPATKELKRYSHLKIRIRFQQDISKNSQAWLPAPDADSLFDPAYKALVVNYKEAAQWRTRPVSSVQSTTIDSTRAWFQPGRQYYRVPVINEGIYHLSYTTLLTFGIDLNQIATSTLALYNKGVSVPFTVHNVDTAIQQSYLEFYGDRNHGIISYFNPYNDTNTYWLTWNDNNPARYSNAAVMTAPIDTIAWAMNTIWNEQDLNYFFGVTQDDLLTTYDLPGKGWYWADFVPGQSKSFPFAIDTIQRKTNIPVTLRARFFGMTVCNGSGCVAPSRHTAYLILNGIVIDSVRWTQNTEAIYNGSFPDSLLKTGSNALQINSKAWTLADSNISKFYLDWFEVSYPRPLTSITGTLKFTALPTGNPVTSYVVNGLPADSVTIIDLTNERVITNSVKIAPTTFTFTDTVNSPRVFYIQTQASKFQPSSMNPKTFTDLRANPVGADYILITHSLFRSEADRLAQYRNTHNKLRTAVIDVQDIYDQFNYGLLDPAAIRSFLKNAYYQWRHPSATYAVFFGDATWDFKKNLPTSVMNNYVPSFGNPPSDNAFVSFDSVYYYLPFMFTGRLPVKSPQEAASVVNKLIGYDAPPLSDWSKSFLFITGGTTPGERLAFNYYSEDIISRYVSSPPVGGIIDRVYKTSDAYIDGENKQVIQNYIQQGLGFINFIGHSGGRVWGVDIGSPNDLQNTDGKLPFVSSVSCNVGFFSDPRSNVLSEDFLLADNRGAIAVWAASSLGYATIGHFLVSQFLTLATEDYARDFGQLTTLARINFWIFNNKYAAPLVVESLNLHPLIGDPATAYALPTLPDFEVQPNDITLLNNPPLDDSTVTMQVRIHNYGLNAGSPILVSINDSYTNEAGLTKRVSDIVPRFYIPDFPQEDSFLVSWNVQGKPGNHVITVTIDPMDSISEVRKDNNSAQQAFYIYRNTISVVSPIPFSFISSLTPVLSVTTPFGRDKTALTYYFEIDTTSDFTSPAKISSGPVIPGNVSAKWQPGSSLLQNHTYYWRAQNTALIGSYPKQGAWVNASFQTTQTAVPTDTTIWLQSQRQFRSNVLLQATVNDSGATLLYSDTTILYARSLGFRANADKDYYSIIKINDVTALGHWWEDPYSYLVAWYNPVDGSYQNKGFNLLVPGAVGGMISFLTSIPSGYYVILSSVWDGKQNVTDSLRQQIKLLGSTKIDSLQRGQSWMLISRKGFGALAESYNTTIAEGAVQVGNTYHQGPALITSLPIGPAQSWNNASWDVFLPHANVNSVIRVFGMKNDTTLDTLMNLPAGTTSVDLSGINPITYPRIKLSCFLSTSDGTTSPVLRQWNVHYLPPADLAVSAWSVTPQVDTVYPGIPFRIAISVYNIGPQSSPGATVSCFLLNDTTSRVDSGTRSIAPGSNRQLTDKLTIAAGTTGNYNIITLVTPKSGQNDLIAENNTVISSVYLKGAIESKTTFRVLFDNKEIHNGDFVSPKPIIGIEYPQNSLQKNGSMYSVAIDGKEIIRRSLGGSASGIASLSTNIPVSEPLGDGYHTLEIKPVDNQNNPAIEKVQFQVASKLSIRDVFNYPNPFRGNTFFTFVLTGSQVPGQIHIKIYTVAGRTIRTITLNPGAVQIGMNKISWDGRDDLGDEIANGAYFYKINMDSGAESAEAIQRLVKIR